jgi:uncharacterized repeat protein (TIGR03809 family)
LIRPALGLRPFSAIAGWFMTLRSDVARGRDLLVCWRELAEKRLAYLTEMFESGRWRRYYSDYAFLENIKEAKIAVETWRSLATPSPARNSIIDLSWSTPERARGLRKVVPRLTKHRHPIRRL